MRSAWWMRWRCSGRRSGFSSAMRRLGIAVVTAAAVAAALTPAGVAQDVASRRHRVTIAGLRFTPADVVADPGDTVEWVNRDLVAHTVTARDESWDSHGLSPPFGPDCRASLAVGTEALEAAGVVPPAVPDSLTGVHAPRRKRRDRRDHERELLE